MKNLYNTLRPEIKEALDSNKKQYKSLYQSVKKELIYRDFVKDLTLGTFKDFELLIGTKLKEDFYLNYWK